MYLCGAMVASALLAYGLDTKNWSKRVSICPRTQYGYFNKILSLSEMFHNIYGKANTMTSTDRP